MRTTMFGLAVIGVALLTTAARAQRQLLSSHETVAVFDGIKNHKCMGKTGKCPWECGDSGEYAEFSINKYLKYKKTGQYGDPEQTKYSYQVSAYKGENNKQPVGDPKIRKAINGLQPGDYVLLSWKHDYVTRGGSSFPERPIVKLERIAKDEAEKMIGSPVGNDGKTSPTVEKSAVTANGDFAMDLYSALARENPGKNLFFSPYSMSSALAMTAEGARGETADQMGKVLRFPEAARHIGGDAQLLPWNTALIHTGMSALNEQFQPKPVPPELRDTIAALRAELDASKKQEGVFANAPPGKPTWEEYYRRYNEQVAKSRKLAERINALLAQVDQYELRVANALYGEKTYPFQQGYLDTINKFYGTGAVVPVDFIHNFEAVRGQINNYVENQTNQRIKDLIAQGGLDKYTRLVLVNAIYFKGEWAMPFDAGATKPEDFLVGAERKVSVPMMRKDKMEGARYGAFNVDGSFFKTPERVSTGKVDPKTIYPGKGGFLVAELPYKGKELSMVVIVPQDAGGLGALETKLTSANLQTWLGKLAGREVNVQLPKFKLETDYQKMGDTLKSMGMVRAFNDPRDAASGAQFDGMCASSDPKLKLYISAVMHKAFVEVNEKGTEAAAATAVAMGVPCSIPRDKPFTPTFRADKPFLFAIRDVKTGTILFLGRVVDPTK